MMNWISVKDRLPEGDGVIYCGSLEESAEVIIYGHGCGYSGCGVGSYIRDRITPEDSGWNGVMQGDFDADRWIITHWMPLPEPPKEG